MSHMLPNQLTPNHTPTPSTCHHYVYTYSTVLVAKTYKPTFSVATLASSSVHALPLKVATLLRSPPGDIPVYSRLSASCAPVFWETRRSSERAQSSLVAETSEAETVTSSFDHSFTARFHRLTLPRQIIGPRVQNTQRREGGVGKCCSAYRSSLSSVNILIRRYPEHALRLHLARRVTTRYADSYSAGTTHVTTIRCPTKPSTAT